MGGEIALSPPKESTQNLAHMGAGEEDRSETHRWAGTHPDPDIHMGGRKWDSDTMVGEQRHLDPSSHKGFGTGAGPAR